MSTSYPFTHLWPSRETIVIVPSPWAWPHFEISLLQHRGAWHACGSWQLSILGCSTPFQPTIHFPSRTAALRNQIFHQRDHMLRMALGRNDRAQLRQAHTIATKITHWLTHHSQRSSSPQQLEFSFP